MVMTGRATPPAAGPPPRRHAGRSWRALLSTASAAVLLVLGAGPALAHDGLVTTSPSSAEPLAAPEAVVLDFSGPPQSFGTQIVVTGPDGADVADGAVEILDGTVTQPLVADLAAGGYAVEWRVTSSDGHPLSGSFDFTVTAPPDAGGLVSPPSSAAPAAPAQGQVTDVDEAATVDDAGPSAPGAWIAVAGAVAAASVLLLVRRSRPRADDGR
jgi:copper resistance protein C